MRSVTYVLPLKWSGDEDVVEMTHYLSSIASDADVIVVDSSDSEVFELHDRAWGEIVCHVPPDPRYRFANGKVNNVLTGIGLASGESIVIADDDVRYRVADLAKMDALLEQADVVLPQNYFSDLPWHALWDTSRTLLNRSFWHDFPGTMAVRRSTMRATGGYDGDVLFENLELIRTCRAAGGTVHNAAGLFVARIPPPTGKFWGQRVRQAYDEFARPLRLAVWLAVLPLAAWLAATGRWPVLAAGAAFCVLLAETGRRRHGGAAYFPARASLFAPLWVLERGVCSWLALWTRVRHGGVRYAGAVIARAATPLRELERRLATPEGGGAMPGKAVPHLD